MYIFEERRMYMYEDSIRLSVGYNLFEGVIQSSNIRDWLWGD